MITAAGSVNKRFHRYQKEGVTNRLHNLVLSNNKLNALQIIILSLNSNRGNVELLKFTAFSSTVFRTTILGIKKPDVKIICET